MMPLFSRSPILPNVPPVQIHGALTLALIILCHGTLQAQTASNTVATQNPSNDDGNAQVLQSWQQQTGQVVSVNSQGLVEFHGAISVDAYRQSVSIPSGNVSLSPLRENNYGKLIFQGDVRTQSDQQDVTYLQGVFTSTNDHAVQARYATQINSFQTGRAGVGYQLAFGDVVASQSVLSTNLGLRGMLAVREFGPVTVSSAIGTVAESWEALLNQAAPDQLPPRTKYLRDLGSLKAEYRLTPHFSLFTTVQSYADRNTSLVLAPGALQTQAFAGEVVTTGAKYTQGALQLSSEWALSNTEDKSAQSKKRGNAFVLDATYRAALPGSGQSMNLRAGHHDLDARFASLAQNIAPGVRETYVGFDWPIQPQLIWSSDWRGATTRVAATALAPASQTHMRNLGNRLNYSFQSITGLVFALSDTRISILDALRQTSRTDNTQMNLNYGSQAWSFGTSLGAGHSRNATSTAADSDSEQWQINAGRIWSDAAADRLASWTLALQGTVGQQKQAFFVAGTQSKTSNLGLNLTASSAWLGQFLLGLQRQNTQQTALGAAQLTTSSLNMDWSKFFGPQWQLKSYAKINLRNHGDVKLQVDERVMGLQGSYRW